jgi:hypothetical protein
MSSIGSRATFKTASGNTVQMMVTEERADLPLYDYEIIDRDGEVLEHGEILGYFAMSLRAQTRNWTPLEVQRNRQ